MNLSSSKITHLVAFCGLLLLAASSQRALADPLLVTVLQPGVQAQTGITSFYETFDNVTPSGGTLTTNFNGSSVTGTYTGDFSIMAADAFGGAGGSKFISTTGPTSSYTLSLSSPINYFGLWLSALDSGNSISFYNGKSLVGTFMPSNMIPMVGACPSATNLYCGNPNNHLDAAEQFAFLNFYDSTGTFDKIVFDDSTGGELESDNQAIGTILPAAVPEPASLFLFGTGILGIAGIFRRQLLSLTRHRVDPSIA